MESILICPGLLKCDFIKRCSDGLKTFDHVLLLIHQSKHLISLLLSILYFKVYYFLERFLLAMAMFSIPL